VTDERWKSIMSCTSLLRLQYWSFEVVILKYEVIVSLQGWRWRRRAGCKRSSNFQTRWRRRWRWRNTAGQRNRTDRRPLRRTRRPADAQVRQRERMLGSFQENDSQRSVRHFWYRIEVRFVPNIIRKYIIIYI